MVSVCKNKMFEILQLCIQFKKKKNPNLAFVEGGYNLRFVAYGFIPLIQQINTFCLVSFKHSAGNI